MAAGALYRERTQRVSDAIACKVPDRVPNLLGLGMLAAEYVGMTCEEAFYDAERWAEANKKILADLQPDLYLLGQFACGPAFEAIDTKIMKWPGHGVPTNSTQQYVEGEYMKPEEYDAYIENPADFLLRVYAPRTSGVMQAFRKLPELNSIAITALGMVNPGLADDELVAAAGALYRAAQYSKKWSDVRSALHQETKEMGFPAVFSMGVMSPFDFISDLLRGMKGAMLDMYRCPDKLHAAMEKNLANTVKNIGLRPKPPEDENNLVFMAIHRGADGFMSRKQFEEFYWPGFKACIMALIEHGYTPQIFWEGDLTSRLEYILELPKGKVLNHFDRIDMFRAKDVLRGHHCIAGGVPMSLLQTASAGDVRDYCKKLIEYCGKDGGFIMTSSALIETAKMENVRAMMDVTREYGVYR